MKNVVEDIYEKAAKFQEKHKDPELNEYLLGLAQKFQDADAMYHHFSYLLMHIRGTIAHQVRPPHLREAIDRATRFLAQYGADKKE